MTIAVDWNVKQQTKQIHDMQLARLCFETKRQKCIRIGITIHLKFSFGEVNRRINAPKSHFTSAPLADSRKTKFLTINLMICLPK